MAKFSQMWMDVTKRYGILGDLMPDGGFVVMVLAPIGTLG